MSDNKFFIIASLEAISFEDDGTRVKMPYGYRVLNYGVLSTQANIPLDVGNLEKSSIVRNCSYKEMLQLDGDTLNYTLDSNGKVIKEMYTPAVAKNADNNSPYVQTKITPVSRFATGNLMENGVDKLGLPQFTFSLTEEISWYVLAEKYDNGQLVGYILVNPYGEFIFKSLKAVKRIAVNLLKNAVRDDETNILSPSDIAYYTFDKVDTVDVSVLPTIGTSSLNENGSSAFQAGKTIHDVPSIVVQAVDDLDIVTEESRDASTKMSNAMRDLKRIAPFYATPLQVMTLVPVDDEDVCPTLGVSETQFYYNTSFVMESITSGQLVFILMHEASHILLRHVLRGRNKMHELYNIAADLYINTQLCNEFHLNPPKVNAVKVPSIYHDGDVAVEVPPFGVFQHTIQKQIDLSRDNAESIYDALLVENPNGVDIAPQGGNTGGAQGSPQGSQPGAQEQAKSINDIIKGIVENIKAEYPNLAKQCDTCLQNLKDYEDAVEHGTSMDRVSAATTLSNSLKALEQAINAQHKSNLPEAEIKAQLDNLSELGKQALSQMPNSPEMKKAVDRLNADIDHTRRSLENKDGTAKTSVQLDVNQLSADVNAINKLLGENQAQGNNPMQNQAQGNNSPQQGMNSQPQSANQGSNQAQSSPQQQQSTAQGNNQTQNGSQGSNSLNQAAQTISKALQNHQISMTPSQVLSALRQIMNGANRITKIQGGQAISSDIRTACETIAKQVGVEL